MSANVDHPYGIDVRGRTASAGAEAHVRDLLEQVLLTAPGERVNRPTFGSGLLDLVFAPGGEAVAAATEHAVHGALQLWLGDVVAVEGVDVEAREGELAVTVRYAVLRTQERRVTTITRERP